MELSWINKLRIAAVAGLGIVVIGILAWPLAAPIDPILPVRAATLGLSGTLLLLVLAFAVGFLGYFIAWPHGREIGILGVPFGLTVWAGRSGPMRALTQVWDDTAGRTALVHSLRVEPFYWMLLVAAGFAGVLLAQRLRQAPRNAALDPEPEPTPKANAGSPTSGRATNVYTNALIALVVSIIVSLFCLGVFVQNLEMSQNVPTQPAAGQILFGVTAAFAIAAFIIKHFLNLSYILPAVASVFVVILAQILHYRGETIQKFAEIYPATFFPHSVFAIVPVQLVALATLGSVLGFWMAVRYDWWKKHETV
ncbi:MAG: hypothetical protein ABFE01_05625 [Phycisphaerales bacterium]